MSHTPRRYPIHIRFNDLDSYGIVNNAVYFTYFEEGRKLWFQDRVGMEWDWQEHGVLLARNEAEYLLPLVLSDQAEIALSIGEVGSKSFEVLYTIYRRNGEGWIACTRGRSVLVCYNYRQRRTEEVPDEWRGIFAES